jgi:uncharacterized protein
MVFYLYFCGKFSGSVDIQQKYAIQVKGLSEGMHRFNFQAGNSFFAERGYSEFGHADFSVSVIVHKKASLAEVHLDIKGTAKVMCDRCLDPFDLPVNSQDVLLIKQGEVQEETGDNEIYIPENESFFDLAQQIYELILLALPLRKVHPEKNGKSTCNKEMEKKLEKISPVQEQIDPRWAALENLKKKTKQKSK